MDELLAVSSMEHAELAEFVDGMSAHVGVPIRLLRWSTAELAERLRGGNVPAWDLLLGTAATALLDLAIVRQLEPLERIDFSGLPPGAVDAECRSFSPSGFVPVFCYDATTLADRRLTAPTSWAALAAPIWRNRIALPDPARSGAGYLHLSALLECRPESAWRTLAVVANLHPLIGGSSTAPIDDVLAGRAWIAATVSTAATRAARAHPSLRWLIPLDARRYEHEVFGCRAGSPRMGLAQRTLSWMLSSDAVAIARRYGKVVLDHAPERNETMQGLAALNVADAGRSKRDRTVQWHTLFTQQAHYD